MEQRLAAVKEILDDGATVTDDARRYGVARQTVHAWLRRYARSGLAGLIDGSSRPLSCPHQMPPQVEARIVGLRQEHPGWGHAPSATGSRRRGYGAPQEILTDNGKVFTGRFGPGTGMVLFDRICHERGIKHVLTAPRSPTTTGKIERWHKTLRNEFLNDQVFASIADAQSQLDDWVGFYNRDRPHQSLGMAAPWERFRLAATSSSTDDEQPAVEASADTVPAGPSATRKVAAKGTISFASTPYKAGRWLAGQTVDVTCDRGLVHIYHRGVLIATHARRRQPGKQTAGMRRNTRPPAPRPSASAASVTRKVDSSGAVCFAGSSYPVGAAYRRRQVQVAVVGDTVEISIGTRLIRTHKVKHDHTREHGALANPGGRPNRINAA